MGYLITNNSLTKFTITGPSIESYCDQAIYGGNSILAVLACKYVGSYDGPVFVMTCIDNVHSATETTSIIKVKGDVIYPPGIKDPAATNIPLTLTLNYELVNTPNGGKIIKDNTLKITPVTFSMSYRSTTIEINPAKAPIIIDYDMTYSLCSDTNCNPKDRITGQSTTS